MYVFSDVRRTLKVGKVEPKSAARFVSQHYSPAAAKSTLAASLLRDRGAVVKLNLTPSNVGDWIKENRTEFSRGLHASHGLWPNRGFFGAQALMTSEFASLTRTTYPAWAPGRFLPISSR